MITPKVPPKKPKHVYKLLIKIFLFDILMRVTPPLSIFALSIVAVAAYKVSPTRAKRKIKSASIDIRQKLADWIRPDADEDIEEVDEFIYNDNDPIVQDAKRNMEEQLICYCDQSFELIASCIDKIYTEDDIWIAEDCTKKEITDFLESMNSSQFKDIEKFFETMPKLSHKVKIKNPNTKVQSEIVLEGLSSFFA